jgi:hypothetical protein
VRGIIHAQFRAFAVVDAGTDDARGQYGSGSGVGGERRYAALERGPFVALLLRCDRVGQLKQLVKNRQHAADCGRVIGAAVGEVLS